MLMVPTSYFTFNFLVNCWTLSAFLDSTSACLSFTQFRIETPWLSLSGYYFSFEIGDAVNHSASYNLRFFFYLYLPLQECDRRLWKDLFRHGQKNYELTPDPHSYHFSSCQVDHPHLECIPSYLLPNFHTLLGVVLGHRFSLWLIHYRM
jgi:hypothetical protein